MKTEDIKLIADLEERGTTQEYRVEAVATCNPDVVAPLLNRWSVEGWTLVDQFPVPVFHGSTSPLDFPGKERPQQSMGLYVILRRHMDIGVAHRIAEIIIAERNQAELTKAKGMV